MLDCQQLVTESGQIINFLWIDHSFNDADKLVSELVGWTK